MVDDVLLNKAAAIERSVRRAREEYGADAANLLANQTRQDAIILNLQRACESSIDAAMHLVRVHRLGIPQETREAFDLLEAAQAESRRCAEDSARSLRERSRAACPAWWRVAVVHPPLVATAVVAGVHRSADSGRAQLDRRAEAARADEIATSQCQPGRARRKRQDYSRTCRFSYHFTFAVAVPMHTTSSLLSPFRFATAHPAADMSPASSGSFDQVSALVFVIR